MDAGAALPSTSGKVGESDDRRHRERAGWNLAARIPEAATPALIRGMSALP
jgi:hypothetical protein